MTIYAPVLFPPSEWLKAKVNGRDLGWWKENPVYKYNAVMLSHIYGKQYGNVRKTFEMRDDVTLVLDSGGFEAMTLGINLDPIQVVNWYNAAGGNICITCDIPPGKVENGKVNTYKELPKDKLVERAQDTSTNTKVMLDRKEGNYMLYDVLHGACKESKDIWYEINKDNGADGWAVVPRNISDPLGVAYSICYMIDKGLKKNCHVLGISGKNTIPVITFAGNYLSNLTYDSSTPFVIANKFRKYYAHNMSTTLRISSRKLLVGKPLLDIMDRLPCECPVCNFYDISLHRSSDVSSHIKSYLIGLHNLYVMNQKMLLQSELSKDYDLFITHLKITGTDVRTIRAVEFIKCAYEEGLEKAYIIFEKYFKQTKTLSKQRNLFGSYEKNNHY